MKNSMIVKQEMIYLKVLAQRYWQLFLILACANYLYWRCCFTQLLVANPLELVLFSSWYLGPTLHEVQGKQAWSRQKFLLQVVLQSHIFQFWCNFSLELHWGYLCFILLFFIAFFWLLMVVSISTFNVISQVVPMFSFSFFSSSPIPCAHLPLSSEFSIDLS